MFIKCADPSGDFIVSKIVELNEAASYQVPRRLLPSLFNQQKDLEAGVPYPVLCIQVPLPCLDLVVNDLTSRAKP